MHMMVMVDDSLVDAINMLCREKKQHRDEVLGDCLSVGVNIALKTLYEQYSEDEDTAKIHDIEDLMIEMGRVE